MQKARLNELEKKVWNRGERLIPGRTHNVNEVQRHKSSYIFFRNVIQYDIKTGKIQNPKILDLGFGCGFGCKLLSLITGATVAGIDIGKECLEYAKQHYNAQNIEYHTADITKFIHENHAEFDYVVSRGVLEHIKDGIQLIMMANWKMRLMFDVPYAEPTHKNRHHVLTNITERDFIHWPEIEFFYEDITGKISNKRCKKPNMIMCTLKNDSSKSINGILPLSVPPAL